MFSSKLAEAKDGVLKITDCSPSSVKAMLEFCYMGVVEQQLFEKHTKDILIIAQKYNIQGLKEDCEKYLGSEMTLKNFAFFLQFADTYACDILMAECRQFLLKNYEEVTNSSDWTQLKKKSQDLINTVLEKVVQDSIVGKNTIKCK